MKLELNINEEFFDNMNNLFKKFCEQYPNLRFKYKKLSKEKMLDKLKKHDVVFASAYYSYLEPSHSLTYLELLNICYTLYGRREEEDSIFLSCKDNFQWIKITDYLKLIDIFEMMGLQWDNIEEMYQFIKKQDFYFIMQNKNIFFGISLNKENKNNGFFLSNDTKKPEIFFKQFTNKLLETIGSNFTLQYTHKKERKTIHKFKNGEHWTYISDVKQIMEIGKFQNNELQNEDIATENNEDLEMYFLFNKENEPLLLASFNREDNEISSIYSGDGKTEVPKLFKPYIDFILEYKNSTDSIVDYENTNLH